MATWASKPWSSTPWASGADGEDPIFAGAIEAAPVVTGPSAFSLVDPGGDLYAGTVEAFPVVHGPLSPPDTSLYGALFPGTVAATPLVHGPFPLHIPPPVASYGTANTIMPITVRSDGYGEYDVESASFVPAINGLGSGQFTTPVPVPSGGNLTFSIGGLPGFQGTVNEGEVEKVSTAERGELYSASVEGHLREWREVVVFPDFGSGYGEDNSPRTRLGSPVQDVRFFDWTMNGSIRSALNRTVERDVREAALAPDPLPLPDAWPDSGAKWMWVTRPGRAASGWCAMVREDARRFPGGMTSFFLCVHDSAELWVDGVKIMETSNAGVTERIDMEVTPGYHRFNIKAYNDGGNAGVLFSAVPRTGGVPDFSRAARSAAGWLCAPRESPPAPLSLPQVIRRLMDEAQSRGALTNWGVTVVGSNYGEPADESITLDVGMSYLDWLNRFQESWLDYYAFGRNLTIVPKGYKLGGFGTQWQRGVDLLSSGTQETLP